MLSNAVLNVGAASSREIKPLLSSHDRGYPANSSEMQLEANFTRN